MTRRAGLTRLLGVLAVIAAVALLAAIGWFLYSRLAPEPAALILIARLEHSDLDRDNLRDQVAAGLAELPGVAVRTVSKRVRDPEAARAEGERAGALCVIWDTEDGQLRAEMLAEARRVRLGDITLAIPQTVALGTTSEQVQRGARVLVGWLLFGERQDRAAQAAWESALAEPGAEAALAYLGAALLLAHQRADIGQITERLERAVALDPASFEARYDLAAAYTHRCDRDGGLAAAQQEIEAAIALQPDDPRGHLLLGDLLERQGEQEATVAAYQKAVERGSGPAAWNKLARAYYAGGQEQKALRAFQQVVANPNPGIDQAAVWGEMCLAYGYLSQAELALAACRTALSAEEDDPVLFRNLGLVHSLQGETEQAIAAYERAAALDDGPSLVALGHLLRQAGTPDEARQVYARAIEVAPCEAEAYLALAQLDFAEGEYLAAQEQLGRGLAIDPHDAQAECLLGMACYLSDDPAQAIRAFERAIALDPRAEEAYLGLGGLYLQQQAYAQAAEAYAAAVSVRPEAVDALVGLGDAQRGLGALAQAEAAYTTAMQLAPAESSIRLSLAVLYDEHGLLEQAAGAYRSALSLQESAAARAALGSVYQRLGQLALAQREYERALALEPGRPDYQVALALVHIAQDQPAKALQQIEAALLEQPEHALAHFLAGLAHEKLGDKDKAIQSYGAALTHSGQDDNLRRNAQAQLSRLGQ